MTIERAPQQWGPGDPDKWQDHGTVLIGEVTRRQAKLIWGEHPHSRRDNNHYAILPGEKEPIGFDGHRPLIGVTIHPYNYIKDSHYSGTEIRKGGSGKIYINDIQVYEFGFRETEWALLHAYQLIPKIIEHPLRYWDPGEKLIGRQIFYREISCNIIRVIRDQGCIIIARPNFEVFPPPIYCPDDEELERELKINIVEPSDNLWFFEVDNPISQALHPAAGSDGSASPPDTTSAQSEPTEYSPAAPGPRPPKEPGS